MEVFNRQRDDENIERTFSTMAEPDGSETYQILEPGFGIHRMPAGSFHVVPFFSEDHGCVVPHYLDVPGHTVEECHIGNDACDTEGCSLFGDSRGKDFRNMDAVLNSRATFDRFMTRRGLGNYRELNTPQKAAAWLAAHPAVAAGFVINVLDVRAAA